MDIGFKTMFMEIYHVRERVMDVLEAISGNRYITCNGMAVFAGYYRPRKISFPESEK